MGLGILLATTGMLMAQDPVDVPTRWSVGFKTSEKDHPTESTAVPIGSAEILVFVAAAGADVSSTELHRGAVDRAAKVIGYDPVSGLGFLKPRDATGIQPLEWLNRTPTTHGLVLVVKASGSTLSRAVFQERVQSIGGKVLPLALLKFSFPQTVPPPGTPLLNSKSQVAAVLFQSDGDQSAYALPVEAVHRVYADVAKFGKFHRGWIGVSMLASSGPAEVERVLAKSPAARAGIKPDDVLVAVGDRQIKNYADAVDAFFYLVPGHPVQVKAIRADRLMTIQLTPTLEKP